MAIDSKRPLGPSAGPSAWAERTLPGPTIQAASAAVAECELFSSRRARRAEALGIDPTGLLSVLADGVEWIWRAALARLPNAGQVLDIFHAMRCDASRRLGRPGLARRVEPGGPAMDRPTKAARRCRPMAVPAAAGQAGVDRWIGYFAKHTDRVGDFGRPPTGRSIGGGGVEGLAKRLGVRLKVAGRGRRVDHPEGMAALAVTVNTSEWNQPWLKQAA